MTDDYLDTAEPDGEDVERAEELAKRDRLLFLLWLAGIYGISRGFTWDGKSLAYRDAQGREVARNKVRQSMERVRAFARVEARNTGLRLESKALTVKAWELEMRQQIRAVHLLSSAIAQGGKSQLSPAVLNQIAHMTQRQYAYLNAFALQVGNKEQLISGRFFQRLEMYINASRNTTAETERRVFENAGYTEEKNILGDAEHCEACVEATDMGWVPIGTLPAIGERLCLTNCQCDIIFRGSNGKDNGTR